MSKVLVFDTTVLCCLLRVPGKGTAGPENDRWDFERINLLLQEEINQQTTFVLPLATIIETGNHIANAATLRYECATQLSEYINAVAEATSPWAAFTEQSSLWSTENLRDLSQNWPNLAAQKISLGDATIADVAEFYAKSGCVVEILTGDQGLKAYQPAMPSIIPRRRQ